MNFSSPERIALFFYDRKRLEKQVRYCFQLFLNELRGSTVKILFFGDTFGRSGRVAVIRAVPQLITQHAIDFVLMNGENMAHGNGLLPEMVEEFFHIGVDAITTGNHAWDKRQIIPYLSKSTRVIRPLNYPEHSLYQVPGRGVTVLESQRSSRAQLGVIQVMGRVFMDALDCPFRAAEAEADRLDALGIQCVVIDFHAEATSEKQAFSHFMDGKVSAIVGTHSHVQTADEKILKGGTATITDVGMCGCFDSVIGVKKENAIQKFLTKRPVRFEPAEGIGGYEAVVIEIDENTGKAKSILRLREEFI